MAKIEVDSIDQDLLRLLALDARVTNSSLAAKLGVAEGTVRNRIKRLQQDGLLVFSAIVGYAIARKSQLAFINVQAEMSRVSEVAHAIADLPLINTVLLTTGQFNITAMGLFDDLASVLRVASDEILAIDGVHHVETAVAVETVKYNAQVAKITRPADP